MSVELLAMVAVLPILVALILMVGMRWPATKAMPLAWLVCAVSGILVWGLSPGYVAALTLQGIVTAIGQAASYGLEDLMELLVLITINLGIFNLLPFPALDGGKLVFLLIEGVTGYVVPEKIQSGLTVAAFALLFGLMLFATYNDILRLIAGAA